MSDESFAALESMVNEESNFASALTAENARLRELLATHTAQPTFTITPSHEGPSPTELAAELVAAKEAQAELARELAAVKASQSSAVAVAVEDQSDELALLRQSLATLASALEDEKARVTAIEEARKSEEEKVSTLRAKVEESRRALMRLQSESANRRTSVDYSAGPPSSRRLSVNYADTTPRRKSSLGLAPIAVGLGLTAEQQRSELSPLSTSPSGSSQIGKASPLSRLTHRRGSASLSVMESSGEEDRTARLRDLRLGAHTLKIHSRRSSAVSNAGDLLSPDEYEPERRRIPSFSFPSGYHAHRQHSISEESEGSQMSCPPSAPLRDMGRKQSVAVFESWSRRSSTASDISYAGYNGFGAPGMMRRLSMGSTTGSESGGYASLESEAENSALKVELHGLRIQLKEAEEGRRASDLCLQALKEYITQGSDGTLSLPPLPSEPEPQAPVATTSRWSIPSLTGALTRKPSAVPSPSLLSLPGAVKGSPNLTSFTSNSRRASVSSNASTSTFADAKATPNAGASAPIFGGFSFSALVSRGPQDNIEGDTSPTAPNDGFPTEPSPLMPEHDECESDFPSSTAPSLTSASDEEDDSSRSSSPVESVDGSPKLESGAGPLEVEVFDASEPVSLVLNENGELVPKGQDKAIVDPTTPRLAYGMAC